MDTGKINWKRLSLALVIGSFVSSITLGFLHAWSGYPVGRVFIGIEDFPSLTRVYFMMEVITVMFVALPTLIILNRFLWLRGSIVLVVGTILGTVWVIPMLGTHPPPYIPALFFAFGGFLAASIFWIVYAGANK